MSETKFEIPKCPECGKMVASFFMERMKRIIADAEWKDGGIANNDDPFVCFSAYSHKEDDACWCVVDFWCAWSNVDDEEYLLEAEFSAKHIEEVRVLARQWLLDNVEEAYALALKGDQSNKETPLNESGTDTCLWFPDKETLREIIDNVCKGIRTDCLERRAKR